MISGVALKYNLMTILAGLMWRGYSGILMDNLGVQKNFLGLEKLTKHEHTHAALCHAGHIDEIAILL